MLGREIKTLINQEKYTGNYEIEFDGNNLPSGIYFLRFVVRPSEKSGNYSATNKLIISK